MSSYDAYLEAQFAGATCPICGGLFAKCGLPNHIRRHRDQAIGKSRKDTSNGRSAAWWDGWKEGYKLGVRDGRKSTRTTVRRSRKLEGSGGVDRTAGHDAAVGHK